MKLNDEDNCWPGGLMKCFLNCVFILSSLWNGGALAMGATSWEGEFGIEQQGEELIDGTQVSLQYLIKIDSKSNRASLSMTTWHAPISCTGDYSVENEPGVLKLYYSGGEENDACPYPSPQFEMRRIGGALFYKRDDVCILRTRQMVAP